MFRYIAIIALFALYLERYILQNTHLEWKFHHQILGDGKTPFKVPPCKI